MKSRPNESKTIPPAAFGPRGGTPDAGSGSVLRPILAALSGLERGSVEIVVHEGRITYIERREQQPVSLAVPAISGGAAWPDAFIA